MTHNQCKELLPAIKHFANDGDLWYYGETNKQWKNQGAFFVMNTHKIENIIEDQHFEARKAFALGGEVECRYKNTNNPWVIDSCPTWKDALEYRPKPKEPIYEWQWLYPSYKTQGMFNLTRKFKTREEVLDENPNDGERLWIKFEPSKRIKND